MKKFSRFCSSVLSVMASLGILLTQIPLAVSAAIEGIDPLIDPTVNTGTTLPEGYDQGLKDGLPYGYFVVDDVADYSFGSAMDAQGNLYTSSYSKGTVTVRYKDAFGYISLLSKEETVFKLDTYGLFGLAINSENNIVYCVCYDSGGYVALYNRANGTHIRLISDLVRPNSCAVDKQDNVYVACEDGKLLKWNKATGAVTTLTSGLDSLQSVAVDENGVVYALAYSKAADTPYIGLAIQGGKLYQINTDGTIETVAGGNNRYVWRARGIAIDDKGYVLLTGEGNAWDNGNSSLIARYDPRTRTLEPVSTGMDYLTFITYGDDGRVYGSLARDDKSIAYSEAAEDDFALQSGWSSVGGSRIITFGGDYTATGNNLSLQVGSLTFTGNAVLDSGSNKLSGWISIPAESLPEVSKVEQSGSLRGVYAVPDVAIAASTGTAKATAMVLREHVRSRWPMIDLYTNAADFSEAPESYLVYFEWTPEDINTYVDTATSHDIYRNTELAATAPAYNSNLLHKESFLTSAATVQTTGDISTVALSGGKAYTRFNGTDIEVKFRLGSGLGDWLGLSVDNRAPSTLGQGGGLRMILGADGSVTARVVEPALPWDSATAQTVYGGAPAGRLADGRWHTLRMANEADGWAVYVDGVCISENAYDGFDADMTEFAGGAATYLTFYSATGSGSFDVDVTTYNKLNFQALNGAWDYDAETDVYTTTAITNTHYITGDLEAGVQFQFQSSGISDWFFINIGNADAVFPSGDGFFYDFCHGTGLKVLFHDGGWTQSKLITATEAEGWNNPAWTANLSGVAEDFHDDNVWHTVEISKAGGAWSVKVNGYELLTGLSEAQTATLNRLLDGNTGYVVFGANGYTGTVQVQETHEDEPVMKAPLSFATMAGEWAYDEATKVYSTTNITNTHYITGDLEAGVEFEFQSSGINDFFFMNIANRAAAFPVGDGFFYDFCHGTGLKVLFHDGGWTQSALITATEAVGWNNPAWTANASGVAADFHDDGVWHKVSISKASGVWSVKVDGTELLSGLSAEQTATLNSLLDGDEGCVVFGSNGYAGNIQVRESEEVAEDIPLSFLSKGDDWAYNEDTGVYSTAGITNTYYITGNLEAGVEFEIQSSGISDWFFINIGNASAVFPAGDGFFYDFCHGTGLKVLFHDGGWTQSALITATEAVGWNNPAWTANASGVAADFHDDGVWHTVSISKASGAWSVKVDGTELLTGMDAAQLATLNSLLDGDLGYVVFGSNGYAGTVQVREEEPTHTHTWVDATCQAPKTCSACGETEGTTVDHVYENDSCKWCGILDPDATGTLVSTQKYNNRLTFEVYEMADGSHKLVVSGTGVMPTNKQAASMNFLNYKATIKSVVIEEGVTTVGYGIFNGWTALSSVSLPSTLTTIDGESFRGCTALKAIDIPDSVTTLGYGAFWGAGLESVVVPASVTSIKNYVFYRCKSLVSAEIYGTTEYKVGARIYYAPGARMFSECSKLSNIVLGEKINLLNTYCFHGTAITEFTVPARVKFVYDAAFHSCTKMTKFVMEEGVTYLGWAALFGCSSLTDVSLPSTITGGNIATWAFGACTSLESIELPSKLTNLKKRTFSGCTSLKSIELPAAVTTLGDRVFIGCTALESVKLSNITKIDVQTFNNCPKLQSITIPETVTSIGSLAFRLNESLKTVYIDSATIAAGLTGNAVYGNMIKWAETIAIRADIENVPSYVTSNYKTVGSVTVDGVEYVTYSK